MNIKPVATMRNKYGHSIQYLYVGRVFIHSQAGGEMWPEADPLGNRARGDYWDAWTYLGDYLRLEPIQSKLSRPLRPRHVYDPSSIVRRAIADAHERGEIYIG